MNSLVNGAQLHAETAASAQFGAWLASQSESIPETLSGVAVLGPPDTGPYAPVAFWPGSQAGASRLADVAERALAERRVVAADLPTGSQGLALPVEIDGRLHGVVALEVANRDAAELQAALQMLHAGMNWVEAWFRQQRQGEVISAEERLMAVLDLVHPQNPHPPGPVGAAKSGREGTWPASPRSARGLRANPDLSPRPRHRLKSLGEGRVRPALSVHCSRRAKSIDCHVDFYH